MSGNLKGDKTIVNLATLSHFEYQIADGAEDAFDHQLAWSALRSHRLGGARARRGDGRRSKSRRA